MAADLRRLFSLCRAWGGEASAFVRTIVREDYGIPSCRCIARLK